LLGVETKSGYHNCFHPRVFTVAKSDINRLHQDTFQQSHSLDKFYPVDQLL